MKRFLLLALIIVGPFTEGMAQSASEPVDTTNPAFDWPSFDEAIAAAQTSGKPILIDIYAPWCGWCRRMQADVYANEDVRTYIFEHFEFGRLNIDDAETRHQFKDYDITSQELGYGLGAQGTPTTVFLDANADYITRLEGYWELASFSQVLRYIGTEAFRGQTFEEFVQASTATNDD